MNNDAPGQQDAKLMSVRGSRRAENIMSAEQDSRRISFFSTTRWFWRTMEHENSKDVEF